MRLSSALALGLVLVGCGSDATEPPDEREPSTCDARDVVLPDGTCLRPGVPVDGCGEGFVHDGDRGCEPTLPDSPCPPGWLAVPGDTECRQHPCGEGTWGDIATKADTQYVDGAYAGGDGDGSMAKPWPSVQQAVDAASPGAVVAIAAGSYPGDVELAGKPVTLWGRCPSMVELVGQGVQPGVVMIRAGADGAVVRGLGLRGPIRGLALSGSQDVRYDQLWIHDTVRGLEANDTIGPASFEMTDVLVESVVGVGVLLSSTAGRLDGVVVRDVLLGGPDQGAGRGLSVQRSPNGGGAVSVEVTHSLFRRTRSVAIRAGGATLTIDDTAVMEVVPESGIGIGIRAEREDGIPTTMSLQSSLVSGSSDVGVLVTGSTAAIETTVVRDTQPSADTLEYGRGVAAEYDLSGEPASLELTSSLVEGSHDLGVVVSGSSAVLTASAVRGTVARAADSLFGDNIAVADGVGPPNIPATMTVDRCLVVDGARAGIASFGAELALETTHLSCHAFDLTDDSYANSEGMLEDRGDNLCGCPTPDAVCQASTVNLLPPSPAPPPQ